MGFFGGSTTYVASTLYNMAGEPLERPNYLKTTVIGAALVPNRDGMSSSITDSYLRGPALKLRSFFRWAEDSYDGIGVPTGTIGGSGSIDADVIETAIPVEVGETVNLDRVESGIADFSNWTEQYLFENNPTAIGTNYTTDISEAGVISITYEDGSVATFTPDDFDTEGVYIYASYTVTSGDPPVTGDTKVWIYKMGSGNVDLDQALANTVNDGEYVPFIPIRLDNEFLSTSFEPEAYVQAKRAYKKVGLGNIDDIIEKLKDNEDLEEIDYAYMFFGVPLNIFDNAGRQYLYRFFDKLRTQQTSGNVEWLLYRDKIANGEQATAPRNVVQIKSSGSFNTNLNMTVRWNSMQRKTGTGPAMIGAKGGDYLVETITVAGSDNAIRLTHQISDTEWEALEIIGAAHDNLIYNNKSVTITATEALLDNEESGFLLPIHYTTYREMSLVDATQLGTQTSFMVLNSYKVVKKKWYQTGFFKLVVFVAVIAVSVLTAGAGSAPAAGLLGSASAVGASIGLSGALGLIVGAIANAVVSMIVMKIIAEGATFLFGEKFGALIGSIVGIVTLQIGTGLMNGMSLAHTWGNMMSASNIIGMTSAVGNGVSGYIMASARETIAETEEMLKEYERKSKELSMKFAEEFGYDKALLDPLSLTSSTAGNFMEGAPEFLNRTLLTGTDIAEMTKDMLNNYAEYTLALDGRG